MMTKSIMKILRINENFRMLGHSLSDMRLGFGKTSENCMFHLTTAHHNTDRSGYERKLCMIT